LLFEISEQGWLLVVVVSGLPWWIDPDGRGEFGGGGRLVDEPLRMVLVGRVQHVLSLGAGLVSVSVVDRCGGQVGDPEW